MKMVMSTGVLNLLSDRQQKTMSKLDKWLKSHELIHVAPHLTTLGVKTIDDIKELELDDLTKGFQVTFASRMHNGDDDPKELYYSNGGELNLDTNKVTPKGGLKAGPAGAMKMQPFLLPEISLATTGEKVVASANTGGDALTSAHMRNWMECVRSRKQPNAPVEAGYSHAIATSMTTAAVHTGEKATFDEKTQEIMAGGKPFKYGELGSLTAR